MIHLLYGLPGSGKTEFLYHEIQKRIENGEKAYLIVPEQQTVEVERTMSRLLPPAAQLSFEVLNFTRLANKLFRLYGGLSYHYITKGMKNLFMWRSVRLLAPFLKSYNEKQTADRTFPETMLSAIGELKMADISPTALASAAAHLPENAPLGHKLHDLSLIYTTYESMVEESYDDVSNDLGKLAALLEEHDFFVGSHVYIDAFLDFTALEYKILRRIFSQAESTTISLLCDSPETKFICFAGIKKTSDTLRRYAEGNVRITVLPDLHRFSSTALMRLCRSLWDFSVQGYEPLAEEERNAVSLLSCEDAYEEARAAVSRVMSLVHNGYRYREIAIVARDAETYRGILDAELEKVGIPFFMSEKTDIMAKPLVSMIFAALTIKTGNYRRQDVIAYLKTGFGGFSDYEKDILEDYVTKWNISGKSFLEPLWTRSPDGYEKNVSKRGETILSVANETKNKLISQLSPFFDALDGAKTTGEFCNALYRFLRALNVDERLQEDAALALESGEKKEAAETVATFRALIDLLQSMTATIGEEPMTLEEFTCALRLVLDGTDIGTIPTAADEVMVGSASMLRATGIRHAILIGLCEGEFPARVSEGSVFSDADRTTLQSLGLSLVGTGKEKAADELLYVYRAMTMPSDGLTLVYRKSGLSGGSAAPSLAFRRACALLAPIREIPFSSFSAEKRIFDKESALEALSKYDGRPEAASICAALADDPEYAERLARRARSVSSPLCQLETSTVDAVLGHDLRLTQSRMETYVSCHFQYYCRYVLRLRETERADFNYANIGTFIHRVLEIFMKETGKRTIDADRDMELIREIVRREMESYSKEIFREGEATVGRIAHLLVRLYRLSTLIAANLCREQSGSRFLPKFFELPIGKDGEFGITPPVITLEDGSTVSLFGVVDRVDTFMKDGKLYIRVVDYKTGKKTFSLEDIKEGFGVQLLLYLFALCDSDSAAFREAVGISTDTPILPAGAVYLSTAISSVETSPGEPVETVLAKASDKITRSGVLLNDEDILHAMSESGDASVLAGISKDKSGNRKGKALTSEEDFDLLKEELYHTVEAIAREMKSGNASATPIEHSGTLPCEYCSMKQFCRVDRKSCIDNDETEGKENA